MQYWTPERFQAAIVPKWVETCYLGVLPYITDFLTSKHPRRKGAVCPFVPAAVKTGHIFFTYFDFEGVVHWDECITQCLNVFEDEIGDRDGAVIILLSPDVPIEDVLKTHVRNKLKCIKRSVMLGVLYRENSAASIHDSLYFPLRTPTPILVMRNMTSSDLLFLDPGHYSRRDRMGFLSVFIRNYRRVSSFSVQLEVKKAKRLFNKHIAWLLMGYGFIAVSIAVFLLQVFIN